MPTEYTFSRFVYCDTNIISYLATDKYLWSRLFEFLKENDLTLGVGSAQVAELHEVPSLHKSIVWLFMSVPTGVLKTWEDILAEEVAAHPQRRTEPLLLYPLNKILLEPDGLQKLLGSLSSEVLGDARRSQLYHARRLPSSLAESKRNFPPSKNGSYTREQADEFTQIIVTQWLADLHRDFLKSFQNNIENFHPEVFLSIRILAYTIFYKYYLRQRDAKELSDFGDLGHLAPIPYCELAIMERDICNVLNQVKHDQDILASTVVRNIDFFKDWSWR